MGVTEPGLERVPSKEFVSVRRLGGAGICATKEGVELTHSPFLSGGARRQQAGLLAQTCGLRRAVSPSRSSLPWEMGIVPVGLTLEVVVGLDRVDKGEVLKTVPGR